MWSATRPLRGRVRSVWGSPRGQRRPCLFCGMPARWGWVGPARPVAPRGSPALTRIARTRVWLPRLFRLTGVPIGGGGGGGGGGGPARQCGASSRGGTRSSTWCSTRRWKSCEVRAAAAAWSVSGGGARRGRHGRLGRWGWGEAAHAPGAPVGAPREGGGGGARGRGRGRHRGPASALDARRRCGGARGAGRRRLRCCAAAGPAAARALACGC